MSETTTQASAQEFKYWAFISYSHQDNLTKRADGSGDHIQWANWLHEQLETFRIPDSYRNHSTCTGEPMPERFFPAFRDEAELATSHDLGGQIRDALARSRYLIIIASPRSACSLYVDEEVRHFRQLGRGNRILTLIVDGEPNVRFHPKAGWPPDADCFCPALVHPLFSSGELDITRLLPEEPISADVRVKDNFPPSEMRASQHNLPDRRALLDFMKLKLLAGLMSVGLDDLVQRDKVRQLEYARKRTQTLRRWLIVVSMTTILAVAGGAVAWQQRKKALENQRTAEVNAAAAQEQEKNAKVERDIARRARAGADQFIKYLQETVLPALDANQKQTLAAEIHGKIQNYLDETQLDPSDVIGLWERLRLFWSRAEEAEERGSFREALGFYETTARMVEPYLEKPEYAPFIEEHAKSFRQIAILMHKTGQDDGALMEMQNAEGELLKLFQTHSDAGHYAVSLGITQTQLARLYNGMGNKTEALAAYRRAVKTFTPFARESSLADSIQDFSHSYRELASLTKELSPNNLVETLTQWDEIMSNYKPKREHLPEYYGACLDYTSALISHLEEDKNWSRVITEWERQVSFVKDRQALKPQDDFIGLIHAMYGQATVVAREQLKQADEAERLLKAMNSEISIALSDNSSYQDLRIFAFAQTELGDFYRESGILKTGEVQYSAALGTMTRTESLRKGSPEFFRDLAIAHQRLGLIYGLQNRLDAALTEHETEISSALKAMDLAVSRQASRDQTAQYFTDASTGAQNKAEILVKMFEQENNPARLALVTKLADAMLELGALQKPDDPSIARQVAQKMEELRGIVSQAVALRTNKPAPKKSATTTVAVTSTIPGSQGERIGIEPGDIVVSYDGQTITSTAQLVRLTETTQGESISLELKRGAALFKCKVKAGRLGIQIENR